MSSLKISQDCLITKNEKSFKQALLSERFIIGADKDTPLFDKTSELILQNVFHYSKKNNVIEIYTIETVPNMEKYEITFSEGFANSNTQFLEFFVEQAVSNYSFLFLDKYNNVGIIAA